MPDDRPITLIIGPTGIGKSEFAISAARAVEGVIVSADAFQVYRGLTIGTAKPSLEIRAEIPHYLVDIRDPHAPYSVGNFVADIERIIETESRPIIVCGGTGFYIHSFLNTATFAPTSACIRQRLSDEWDSGGSREMWAKLLAADSTAQNRMGGNDKLRIVRALEIIELTGRLPGYFGPQSARKNVKILGLTADRNRVYERISNRTDQMMAAGWIDEVRALLAAGYQISDPAFNAIGYREIVHYLSGSTDQNTMVDLIKMKTRHLAKRQYTWFRRIPNVVWTQILTA